LTKDQAQAYADQPPPKPTMPKGDQTFQNIEKCDDTNTKIKKEYCFGGDRIFVS